MSPPAAIAKGRAVRGGFFLACLALATPALAQNPPSWQSVQPLFETYCFDCHGDGADKGNLNLDPFTSAASILQERKVWDTIQYQIDNW